MDMDLRQLQHIFLVIALVRSLVADHSVEHSRPNQGDNKE